MWIRVYPTEKWTLIQKMVERDVFLMKPKHQYHYPNEESVLRVPNHEMKGDYDVNLRLS